MQILWIPAWYPNAISPLGGDFIQRHARAVSLYHHVEVIYVVRDKKGIITKNIKAENHENGRLTEKIVYYHTPVFPVPFIDKLLSTRKYQQLYRKYIREYIHNKGIPACTHVHVADKNGLVAWWLKKKFNIPFVISEHWTIYLPGAKPGFAGFHWLFRVAWKKLMEQAAGFSFVSRCLGEAVSSIKKNISYSVIPNVVDENIFFPASASQAAPACFIHVSSLDYQKDPETILQAFALVKQQNPAFILRIFGPPHKNLEAQSLALGLKDHVIFLGEVPQPQLAAYMQSSMALVLYSRYETFGCVLIEANACGIPVIVSDIPVLHEIIRENENGFFVEPGNAPALAEKILWLMQAQRELPDKQMAATTREQYGFARVGKMFDDFYRSALGKS